MAEHLREAALHSLVAALVAEALLRTWPQVSVATRLRLRLFAFAGPVAVLAVFEALAPWRHAPAFGEHALFVSTRWNVVKVAGVGLADLALVGLAALGVVLLLADLLPWLVARHAVEGLTTHPEPPPPSLVAAVAARAAALGLAAPRVEVVHSPHALLRCTGGHVTVSTGALAVLDEGELDGALAHELAHLAHHDVRLGWWVLAGRVLQAFNPVAQVWARAASLELERRADEVAARSTGRPATLASAVLKTFLSARGGSSSDAVLLGASLRRAREAAVEDRCRRLLQGLGPADGVLELLRPAVAFTALSALLFFVT